LAFRTALELELPGREFITQSAAHDLRLQRPIEAVQRILDVQGALQRVAYFKSDVLVPGSVHVDRSLVETIMYLRLYRFRFVATIARFIRVKQRFVWRRLVCFLVVMKAIPRP